MKWHFKSGYTNLKKISSRELQSSSRGRSHEAGLPKVSRAGSVCRDLGTSVTHTKKQIRDNMEKSQPGQPGSRYRDAEILARRAENFPCNRDCRANTFLSLNFASEQNGSPNGQYFSLYTAHKGLSDHKAS